MTSHEKPEPGTMPGGHETILLVDDDESLRELGKDIFESVGYQVDTAGTGEEALEIYRKSTDGIDLVLLDLDMPGMGGSKCLGELLVLNPHARVVIASGDAHDAKIRESLSAGAATFVAKPFRLADLLTTIRRVFDTG